MTGRGWVTVRIREQHIAKLRLLSATWDESIASIVETAVTDYLDGLDDLDAREGTHR